MFKSADDDLDRLSRMKSQDSGKPSQSNWSNAQIKEEERKNKIESVLIDNAAGSSDSLEHQHKPQSDKCNEGGLANILNAIEDSNKSNASNVLKNLPNDSMRLPSSKLSKHNSLEPRANELDQYIRQQMMRSNSIETMIQKHNSLSSLHRA